MKIVYIVMVKMAVNVPRCVSEFVFRGRKAEGLPLSPLTFLV